MLDEPRRIPEMHCPVLPLLLTVGLGNGTLGRVRQTETPNPDNVLLWWLYQRRRVELVRLRRRRTAASTGRG